MRAHDHRTAPIAGTLKPLSGVAHADGIEAGGRLVEQQELGPGQKGLGEADALGQPPGERGDGIPGAIGDPGLLEHRLDLAVAIGTVQTGQGGMESEKRLHRHAPRKRESLGEVSNANPRSGVRGIPTAEAHAALVGAGEAEQQAQGRGLAGAIGPEQSEGSTRGQLQIHAGQRAASPESLRYRDQFQGEHGGWT